MLILWVVASEASSPTTRSLTEALRDALRNEGAPAVHVRSSSGRDGSVFSAPADAGVVVLRWQQDERPTAHLQCYLPRSVIDLVVPAEYRVLGTPPEAWLGLRVAAGAVARLGVRAQL